MFDGNIIQPVDIWPRHHPRTDSSHEFANLNGRGNGMIMLTIQKNVRIYETLFERLMDTPVTGAEWNDYMGGGTRTRRTASPGGIDSFDIWLRQHHSGYSVYMCQMAELTDVEQDAFDAYHEQSLYGTRVNDCLVLGLLGAYYNDPEVQ